ncbi:MAG: radical SAM protein [Candidatus Kaelpia aquatica]|nr:radical SAM protein [Candidatus Kaelpia aquatica]
MKICFIFPPFKHKLFSENISVVDEEFILPPPIILAWVAAIAQRAGHRAKIIDANALKLSKKETLKLIKIFAPDILAFRLDSYHFHTNLEWIQFFKNNLNLPVLVGGINLDLYPYETMFYPEIDYAVIGEAIDVLPKLLSSLENKTPLSEIEGIAYRDNEEIIIQPPRTELANLDQYPYPARELLPNHLYHSFVSQRKNFTIMLTSTGCPYNCKFCAIANVPYRNRSPINVVDEIELCYKKFKIREIDFFDAVFFLDRNRAYQICDGIIKRNLKIEWSARSRVDLLDEEIIKIASKAGCKKIFVGIESKSLGILKSINKEIEPEEVRRCIKLLNKYKIKPLGFFIFGNPGETIETIRDTTRFALELNLDYVQICRMIAKPGSKLHEEFKKITGYDFWQLYIKGVVSEQRLPNLWCNISEVDLEKYIKKAYILFYFRPRQICNRIKNVKSFAEFMRYLKVGSKVLLSYLETCKVNKIKMHG